MRRHPYIAFTLAFVVVTILFGVCVWGVTNHTGWPHSGERPYLVLMGLEVFFDLVSGVLALTVLWHVIRDMGSPRAARWIAGTAALAYAAVFIHGLASGDALGFLRFLSGLSVRSNVIWAVFTPFFGMAAFLRRRNWRVVPLLLRIASFFMISCLLITLADTWFNASPFRAAVRCETAGDPPREVVLSRTWCGWVDSFDMRLYVRADDGRWETWLFDYWPWPIANSIVGFRDDGIPEIDPGPEEGFKDFGRRPDVDASEMPWEIPYGELFYPAEFSPDDLHAAHRKLCRSRPSGFRWDPPSKPLPTFSESDPPELILLGAGDAVRLAPDAVP